jgi:hypothetical protein
MKIVKNLMMVLALSSIFVACKKDKDTPAYVVEGTYEGKLGSGVAIPTGFFGLQLKAGGVLNRITSTGDVTGTGTWKLVSNKLTGDYVGTNGIIVSIEATLDQSQGRFSGTWENSVNNDGTFYATKNATK